MPYFAVTYVYDDAQTAAREANKPAHREWLASRVEEGSILSVGPFTDGSGALLVVRADDAGAAARLVAADPHLVEGFVTDPSVREWLPVFGLLSGS